MEILDNANLAIVLVSPRNTLNIGAVARAMSNFGCSDLRVAAIYYKEFRSASSAVGPAADLLRKSRDYDTVAQAIEDCTLVIGTTGVADRGWHQPLERLEQSALRIRVAMQHGRVALLFGSEKFGLSNDDVSHCHALLHIPTRDEHASMNLGQAAAVCLYELSRISPEALAGDAPLAAAINAAAAPEAVPTRRPKAPPAAGELDRLASLFEETLLAAEYPAMHTRHRSRQLRILSRRLGIPAGDASHWIGFLRQILWKLRS
ncbi:MAG TPA: RNA methyltransferase [Acidobacteriaceae bacterium]